MSSYKIVGGDRKEYGPVSSEALRQWIIEGRANGETLVQGPDGIWKKLAAVAEFSDVLPSAPPAQSITPPPLGSNFGAPASPDRVKGLVLGPAIALLVLGILTLGWQLIGLGTTLLGQGERFLAESTGNPTMDHFLEMMVVGPIALALHSVGIMVSVVILLAGIRMMNLRNHTLALVASVLAIIPCLVSCPCCCLGIPIGIWSLVVLVRPDVKAAFVP